jgi:uncharacterized protein (DUF885 family)
LAVKERGGRGCRVNRRARRGPGQGAAAKQPVRGVLHGVSGYDDAVPDLSPQARQAWRDRLVGVLVGCEQLEADAHDGDSRVLLAAARDHATRGLALIDSRVQEFSVTTLPWEGPSAMLLVTARAPTTDAASASAYLTRCRSLPTYLDQYAARLRTAAASGLLPVAPLVEGAISQVRDHLAQPDRDPLLGHRPPEGWDGAAAWREELERVVRDEVRPALGRHLDLLVELLPRARPPERAGLLYVPGGTAAYACCIRNGTTLALDAEELHQLGLTVLAEVEERIAELGGRALGARDAAEVLARLREDPSLQAAAGRDAMAGAAAAIARAEEQMADLFRPPLPPPCTIQAMPRTWPPPARRRCIPRRRATGHEPAPTCSTRSIPDQQAAGGWRRRRSTRGCLATMPSSPGSSS